MPLDTLRLRQSCEISQCRVEIKQFRRFLTSTGSGHTRPRKNKRHARGSIPKAIFTGNRLFSMEKRRLPVKIAFGIDPRACLLFLRGLVWPDPVDVKNRRNCLISTRHWLISQDCLSLRVSRGIV